MVLTARRQGLLEDLRDELLARYEDIDIHVAKLDVSDTSTVLNMPETLPAGFRDVSLLLNNAGLAAGFGSVSEYNMEDLNTMMDEEIAYLKLKKILLILTMVLITLVFQVLSKCLSYRRPQVPTRAVAAARP